MRGNERKQQHNRSILSNVRGVVKDYRALITAGKKDEAAKALPGVHSTLDKAVKSGVLPRPTVNRKKSRLAACASSMRSTLCRASATSPMASTSIRTVARRRPTR